MPRFLNTTGNRALDEELDRLWRAVEEAKQKAATATTPAATPSPSAASGSLEVKTVDGSVDLFPDTLELDTADGFALSDAGNGMARIDRTPTTVAPADVAGAASAGTSTEAANADHVHKGSSFVGTGAHWRII